MCISRNDMRNREALPPDPPLVLRARAREEEAELTALFDAAWDSLADDERAEIRREREAWMDACAGG